MKEKKIFALGFFDGVHLGHQEILKNCCELAMQLGATPCAITFLQHPQTLFAQNPPQLINTYADRKRLLRQFGIGPVYAYPVTREIMGMPWETFLEELMGYGAVGFVCGRDFRFGNRGEGNAQRLQNFCRERNLAVRVVDDQKFDGIRISSTHIRKLLEDGHVAEANRFLGHPHILSGEVVTGKQIGRTIGIPTANLAFPEELQPLPYGVYACKVQVEGEEYMAVTNIGTRPTVAGKTVTVEPHLLDFTGDLYGKTLTLSFCKFLRPERKFNSLEELKAQITEDTMKAKTFLR